MKRDALPLEIIYGSVCSGIEAASEAWHPLGWSAAWVAKIEPFPARVLHHHYGSGRPLHMPDPDEANDALTPDDRDARRAAIKAVSMLPAVTIGPRNLGDMTKIAAMVRAGQVAAPDVLVGGTPCQAFSIAGLRESLADARGQLTLAFVNIANEIDTARHVRGDDECVIVWENVPGVLSTQDNAFGCFLGALAGEDSPLLPPGGKWPNAGCVFGPQRRVAWRVLDAQYFGVAQRRRRVFVVASARKGFDPTEVLFEFDGVRRDSPPRREAGESTAAGTLRGTDGGSDVDHAIAGHLQSVSGTRPVERDDEDAGASLKLTCVSNAEGSTGLPFLTCSNIAKTVNNQTPLMSFEEVAAPVTRSAERPRGDGLDTLITQSPPCETRLGAPIAFSSKDYGADAEIDLSPTIRAGNHRTSHANGGQPPAIAFDARQDPVSSTEVFGALGSSSPQAQAVCVTGEVTHTLKAEGFDASEGGTGRGQPIVAHAIQAGALRTNPDSGPDGVGVQANVAYTLEARAEVQCAQMGMAVRRLTPRECERLQSFPDFHTLIPLSKVKASRAETLLVRGEPVAEIDGQWWKLSADGPRYKALGNSMCVFNMRWIGRRVHFALTGSWPACANFTHEREMGLVAT